MSLFEKREGRKRVDRLKSVVVGERTECYGAGAQVTKTFEPECTRARGPGAVRLPAAKIEI